MHILIVEDERALCDTIARSLRRLAYSVDCCYDGQSAAEMLAVERFDLVVLDLNLPGEDGMTVLRTLRERDRDTKVLILSARCEVADKVAGLDAGANDYLTKPFHLDELAARIRSLTLRHGAHLRLHRQGVRRQHAAGAARRRGHFVAAHHALGCQLPRVHAAVYAVRGRHRHHPPRAGFPAQDRRRRGPAVLGGMGRGVRCICDRGVGVMRLIDYLLLAIVAVCAVIAWRVWRRAMKKGGCCGSGCTGNCAQCGRNCDCKKEK